MTEVIWNERRIPRKTAAERRFDDFTAAIHDLGCEESVDRLGSLVLELIPVRRPIANHAGDTAKPSSRNWRVSSCHASIRVAGARLVPQIAGSDAATE